MLVVATVIRLPGLLMAVGRRLAKRELYKKRGLRRELVVQCSLILMDLLCLPCLLLVALARSDTVLLHCH